MVGLASMRVLFVAAEAYPLAKTGGLADVSAALPAALQELGAEARVLMPAYPCALECAPSPQEVLRLGNPLGCGETRLLASRMPGTMVPVWLVDCPALFNRTGGLYQDSDGIDWPDNHLRFALLSHVAAGIARETGSNWQPHIVHANDWHAALTPLLMSETRRNGQANVFTVHNLAFQGNFAREQYNRLGLPPENFNSLEFYGHLSFLKAGLQFADAITTVSPSYAREILTPEYGCGLDGLLRERASRLTGILNGVDYAIWDPAVDPHLSHHYSSRTRTGKHSCKSAVQQEFGLECKADVPLIAVMSRLAHQKMTDVILNILPALLCEGVQFALVAGGEKHYEDAFRELAASFPGHVGVKIGYDEVVGHRLLAGADILLHPARFEPCGLVPIYALRYGTVPVVRKCGGMADTVADPDDPQTAAGEATGFTFEGSSAEDMLHCLRRALEHYRQPVAWRRMERAGMEKDFGWRRSAKAYLDLYASLLNLSKDDSDGYYAKAEKRTA